MLVDSKCPIAIWEMKNNRNNIDSRTAFGKVSMPALHVYSSILVALGHLGRVSPACFFTRLPLLILLLLPGWSTSAFAQVKIWDIRNNEPNQPKTFILPYVFSSETYGFSVGAAGMVSGVWQDQATFYGSAFMGANQSYEIMAAAYDLRVSHRHRLFVSPEMEVTRYGNVHAYVSGNPSFPGERPGSNDSDSENYITNSAWDMGANLRFRYVLPWGHGEKHIVNTVALDRGLLHSPPVGGKQWNPLSSGRTTLMIDPFFRDQRIDRDIGERSVRSNGVRFEIKHDNTDFILNPSRGSIQRLAIARDWAVIQGSHAWTQWEAEYSKFLSLGATDQHRQRVLAFDAWLSDVPTWQLETVGATTTVDRRPPYFEGSTLGGFDRLRAFPSSRFHDRSAVYYSLEYRAIPAWNPFDAVTWLPVEVDWWQWVVYGEVGRVADNLDLHELHQDMKWDLGVGIRTFSEGIVGRVGIAFSREDWSMLALFGHPF